LTSENSSILDLNELNGEFQNSADFVESLLDESGTPVILENEADTLTLVEPAREVIEDTVVILEDKTSTTEEESSEDTQSVEDEQVSSIFKLVQIIILMFRTKKNLIQR
jgi:hypothetical protein